MSQPQCLLRVDPFSKALTVSHGKSILECLIDLHLDVNASCGGVGNCGKCVIQRLSEEKSLGPITEKERGQFSEAQIAQGYRLACQATIQGDAFIHLTETFLGRAKKKAQILTAPNEYLRQLQPTLHLKPRLPDQAPEYGIAFDLGTTTIVGYLVELHTGETLAIHSLFNPQITLGEDVISRIGYAEKSPENTDQTQKLVIYAFDQIIAHLLQETQITSLEVKKIVVVGNTAMHHLFFKLPVNTLGRSPYSPAVTEAWQVLNEEIGLSNIELSTPIYSPPLIAGFVGADTTADILAVRQDLLPSNTLMIDIGTNGELTLGGADSGIIAVSVAAGPAFEGAQITFGMRGETGAIERIKIDPESLEPEIEVIGNTNPMGLCGSAIIDIVAEMLRAKIITRSGNFNKAFRNPQIFPRIRQGTTGWEYIIHSQELPAIQKELIPDEYQKDLEIYITQGDIREIQKAKGAFLSGALLLLQAKNQQITDLDQILIAGAFGTYLHKENAKFIGLIPDIDIDRIHQLGNAAGEGAKLLVLSDELREVAKKIGHDVQYYELANSPDFGTTFANSMIFPHRNLDLFPSLKAAYEHLPFR